jgi:hypothetical protein
MLASEVDGMLKRKCSMFGITQTATRAPFGQRNAGRSMIGE